jgi:hypothetical protein
MYKKRLCLEYEMMTFNEGNYGFKVQLELGDIRMEGGQINVYGTNRAFI